MGKLTLLQLEAAADLFRAAPSIVPRPTFERRSRLSIAIAALLAIGLSTWLLSGGTERTGSPMATANQAPPVARPQPTAAQPAPTPAVQAAPKPQQLEPATPTQPPVMPESRGKRVRSAPQQHAALEPRSSSAAARRAPRNRIAARSGETRKLYRTLDF